MAEAGNGKAGQAPEKAQYTAAELQYILQVYEGRYQELTEELKGVIAAGESLDAAIRTLQKSDDIKKKGAMLPVGAGLYLPASVGAMDSVIVDVGADFAVEKGVEDAGKMLKKRLDRQSSIMKKLLEERRELEELVRDLSLKLEEAVG